MRRRTQRGDGRVRLALEIGVVLVGEARVVRRGGVVTCDATRAQHECAPAEDLRPHLALPFGPVEVAVGRDHQRPLVAGADGHREHGVAEARDRQETHRRPGDHGMGFSMGADETGAAGSWSSARDVSTACCTAAARDSAPPFGGAQASNRIESSEHFSNADNVTDSGEAGYRIVLASVRRPCRAFAGLRSRSWRRPKASGRGTSDRSPRAARAPRRR